MLWACGDEDDRQQTGAIEVTAYGESFIEKGIPASEMVDGWAVTFSHFKVRLTEVRVAGSEVEALTDLDLARPSSGAGHLLGSARVPTGQYTEPAFSLQRIEIHGSARSGSIAKTFQWVFDIAVRYEACETTTEVQADQTSPFQITIHADHLFSDSLVAEAPALRFQALADADADADGSITQAELSEADIGAYDPGSEGGIDNLWAWLNAQAGSLGHVDGEGHCDARAID